MSVGAPAGDGPFVAGSAPPGAERIPRPPLSIEDLRHPSEASRLALALIASSGALAVVLFVLVSLGQILIIWSGLLVILIIFGVLWWALQIRRVTMLADGVRVSAETLPEVQGVLDEVLERLDFRQRLDMFVVNKMDSPITLASLFGVRILLVEGGVLGDLTDVRNRRRLMFLLATYVGALKARHTQASSALLVLDVLGLTKLVHPFVSPWYRATVYTGDRIAYACLGDLDVSLESVYAALVGKETAGHLRAPGLAAQALIVRRSPLVRLAQLHRSVPHATNRYLELLAFARTTSVAAAETVRRITSGSPAGIEKVLDQLRDRRPSPAAVPLAGAVAVCLVLGGIVLGLQYRDSPLARAAYEIWMEFNPPTPPEPSPEPPEVTPIVTPIVTPDPLPTRSAPSELTDLWASLVPADLFDDCHLAASTIAGALSSVECMSGDAGNPEYVHYSLFAGQASLQSAFESVIPSDLTEDAAVRATGMHAPRGRTTTPREETWPATP